MKLCDLTPAEGDSKKAWRKGRGAGSGNGKTAGKGHKGQNARSGGGVRVGFEGGQMPITRRLPKRGFTNVFAKKLVEVYIYELERFEDGTVVDAQLLLDTGVISKANDGIRVLANGELTKKLTVKAAGFTKAAQQKIEAAGGKAEVI